MMDKNAAGFREIEHTADWALEVWAPDLADLFSQAARGMYWLMQASLEPAPRVERRIELDGPDAESLLVAFLSELLYMGEMEGMAFDSFLVKGPANGHLSAVVRGAPIAEQKKEIKAVTYHNLAIHCLPEECRVTIVFDV